MTVDKLVGPATVIYLISMSVAALWWASDLTARVAVLEHTTVTAERIARIETEVATLADVTKDLRQGVNELVREFRSRDK
jgi:hypothetical protein